VHPAVGFVLEHPAVSSAIVGPRTMEHLESQLGVEKIQLSRDVLDRIDRIVPPGVTLNEANRAGSPVAGAAATAPAQRAPGRLTPRAVTVSTSQDSTRR